MSVRDAIETILIVLAGVSGIVEISPIKINPWTWLIRTLGRALNHDTNAKVDQLSKDVESLSDEMQERNAINARVRILRFGDECRIGIKHSKDYFDQIENDITIYENYCLKNPEFKNNMTALTIEYINKIFARCLEKNDFL